MKITDAVQEFILYKQSLGMSYRGEALKLNAFARLTGPVEIDSINTEAVRRYLDGERPITAEWASKHSTLKTFFRFALARGYASRNPLPLPRPKYPRQFQPYIYSVEEVQRMLRTVDSRHRGQWHLEPYTIRTLLLLLYGTGLRISEAVNLRHRDVDLDAMILTIRETKFYKSRLVPVGEDLASVLLCYFKRKWNRTKSEPDAPFIATYDGRPVTRFMAEDAFKRIRYEAGVKRTDGFYYQPRLHDFRHTFAVRRLVSWYREGKNVQRLLPHLATYLGHVGIRETARYLSMTKELLHEAGHRFELYATPGGER
ncbi:MAG: tyrosine-type recombinase/integrase [Candidatus Sulfotelmatobacter sp.]